MKRKIEHWTTLGWFIGGLTMGCTGLTIAVGAVPNKGRISDDTALYQNLSEIRVGKTGALNTEQEIARLASLERKFSEEKLPRLADHSRVRPVVERISKTNYRGKKKVSKEDRELDQID